MEKKIDMVKLFAAIYRSLHIYKGVAESMDRELRRQGFVAVDSPNGVRFAEIKQPQYTNDAPLGEDNELNLIYPTVLAESKFDMIRNEIIAFVEQSIHRGGGTPIPREKEDKWIAWLEKRGGQNLANTAKTCKDAQKTPDKVEPKFKVGDIIHQIGENTIFPMVIEEIKNGEYVCDNNHSFINIEFQNCYELVEQKPADKTEPKFKVGDWVVHNNANFIFQVVSVGSYGYKIKNRENYKKIMLSNNEDKYRLWTIQDAKEGDVLYSPKGVGVEAIFLIKGWRQVEYTGKTLCGSIVYRVEENKIVVGGLGAIWWDGVIDPFYPATKEQRDLLFKKMHEAGYEWNAEKKELIKIDQNFILNEIQPKQITPEESLGISSEDYNKVVDECIFGEKKPAWSEEDEKMVEDIIEAIDTQYAVTDYNEMVNWLKGIKDRVQHQSTWKPSDEQMEMLENVRKILHTNKDIYSKANNLMYNFEEFIRTLEKLKG